MPPTPPQLGDHLFVALIVVGLPLYGWVSYPKFVERARQHGGPVRTARYWQIVGLQWSLVAALGAWWVRAGRSIGDGVQLGSSPWLGLGITTVVIAGMMLQYRALRRLSTGQRDAMHAQIAGVADLLPHTRTELRTFQLVSATAGVCEEILFRGFLLWYLCLFVPVWPAILLGAVAFGWGHAYQGAAGMVKTGIVGLAMGAIYHATGSLLWPMILHSAIDLQGGAVAFHLLSRGQLDGGDERSRSSNESP